MIKYCTYIFLCILMMSCGGNDKKPQTEGGNAENAKEFVDYFPPINTVFNFSKDSLAEYSNDAGAIDIAVFKNVVSDSILQIDIDKSVKKIYAIGRIDKAQESFYIAKLKLSSSNQLIVFVLDKSKKCLATLTLLDDAKAKKIAEIVEIDGKNNFNKLLSKKMDNTVVEGKEMYVYDEKLHQFVLVLKDSIGDEAVAFINPIDTLARTNIFAGDYIQHDNVLSIRDSKKKNFVEFFLYINDKTNGCKGELRGEAAINSDNILQYNKPGDPCILQFELKKNIIILSEVKGCGSRLGDLKCSFNNSFKKKVVK